MTIRSHVNPSQQIHPGIYTRGSGCHFGSKLRTLTLLYTLVCRIKNCAPFYYPNQVTRLQDAGGNRRNGNRNRHRNRRRGKKANRRNNRGHNGDQFGGNQGHQGRGNQYGHQGHRKPETIRIVVEVHTPRNNPVGVAPQVQPVTNNTQPTECNKCKGCTRGKANDTIYHRLERIEQQLEHAIDLSVRAEQARAGYGPYSPRYSPTSPPYPEPDIDSDTSDSSVEELHTSAVKKDKFDN